MENLTFKMHKVLEENKNISVINEILQRQVDIKNKEVENRNSTAKYNDEMLDKLFLQLWTCIEVKFNEKVALVNRDIDAKITMHNHSKSSSFETYSNAAQKKKYKTIKILKAAYYLINVT
ncbi:hypothetical protein WA026_001753 [Henosepilachna vigintioctopunctata]|uniref:Uncharacterized protein n=1 Tax=Henosepilachna vigintioctopunctata TaxID=420089 RepID=A0AAW1UUR0_9CUCU